MPRLELDEIVMEPPWALTILCVNESPKPVPSDLVVKKGSKIRSRFSGAIAGSFVRHFDLNGAMDLPA